MGKLLVVAPQAGFGNRMRALCSGIVLARYLQREVRHLWLPEENATQLSPFPHVAAIQNTSFESLFQATPLLPRANFTQKATSCYGEWGIGSYWHQYQGSGWRHIGGEGCAFNSIATDATALLTDDSDIILLETSHVVMLPACAEQWSAAMTAVYQELFVPRLEYTARLPTPTPRVGVSLRRGEFLIYFPEARQEEAALRAWWLALVATEGSDQVMLFSDDYRLRDELRHASNSSCDIIRGEANGFVEFLALSRCAQVYGTPSSSFAVQAALFGGGRYNAIAIS